jgi:RNA polymerase sigma factor (sigma-70 family)
LTWQASDVLRRDPFADLEPLIRRVYAYVAYRVGDGPDADDITSATFERALRYRDSFDPRKGDAAAWLIGIARRQIAGQGQVVELPQDDLPEQVDPVRVEDRSVTRLDLAAAVARLGPRDRELIALRYGADLTAEHIASLLELNTNAVEVALHRALTRLRAIVDEPPTETAAEGSRRSLPASGL